jgi:hypothetical protein
LLELPQWDDGDRQDDAAAHTCFVERAMLQLPHEYGVELYDLYDEPFGGERVALRQLPQWFLYVAGNEGGVGCVVLCGACGDGGPGLFGVP